MLKIEHFSVARILFCLIIETLATVSFQTSVSAANDDAQNDFCANALFISSISAFPELPATLSRVSASSSFLFSPGSMRFEDTVLKLPEQFPSTETPACVLVAPSIHRLRSTDEVSAEGIAAALAVMDFRKTNPWPVGPIVIEDANTAIVVRGSPPYFLVTLLALNPSAKTFATCRGQEYYRVGNSVLPYNGCGTPVRGLPELRDLPDNPAQ